MAFEITHDKEDSTGAFNLIADFEPSGELVYHREEPNKMVIEHTEVAEILSGKGAGKKLLEAAISFAREENLKIIPQCSYAAVMFRRIKEWDDVLYK
jgi:uncharacterized protein